MVKDPSAGPPENVEEAMNRVLQAEREAEQAIADCEHEARQILQAAHQRVKRIADRTDERIARIQQRLAHKVRTRAKALERTERAAQQAASPYALDAVALAAVVQEVAAELTGHRGSQAGEPEKSGGE